MAKTANAPAPHSTPRFTRKEVGERKQQLIAAAIRCLGEGGLGAFTIDRICRQAGVSRGLINHHFESKEALLVAAYEAMTGYMAEATQASLRARELSPSDRLNQMIEASFAPESFDRATLRAWLALWGEVSTNEHLRALHRARYDRYRKEIVHAVSDIAKARGRQVKADQLALMLIALIDGLWLEWCLDSSVVSPKTAKAACYELIELHLGTIKR